MIADTHTLIWFLEDSTRLTSTAIDALDRTVAEGRALYVSSVSFVELVYLTEKRRLSLATLVRVKAEIDTPDSPFRILAFNRAMAEAMARIPRDLVPDMPDRMIAATALHLNLPLVTADAQIRRAPIETVW